MVRQLKTIVLAAMAAFQFTPALARDDYRGERRDEFRTERRDDRREEQWVLLGEQTVGFSVDNDIIRVGREEGSFSRIRIEARNNDIYLYSAVVKFGNGSEQQVAINALIPAGGRSQNFDLKGDRRAIRQISLTYKARPGFPGRTVVAVFGAQLAPEITATPYSAGPGYPPRGGPQVLDQRIYDRRADRIDFRPQRPDMRLSQISVRPVDDQLAIESMEIRFNVGPPQFVNVYDRLSPGEASRPVDIDGERRIVTGVTVIKRPSWRPGDARMELLGVERERPRPSLGAESGRAPPGWVLFGAQQVGFNVDRDVIRVGAEIGRFTRIALSVRDAGVFLREITLVYANGQRDTKDVYTSIPANSRTRPIEIEGSRFIREIELVYQSEPNRRAERAVVEVYGEYERGWLGDRGGYRDYNRGALLLGAHRAQMFSSDDDAYIIGPQFGTFRSLRLTARNYTVRVTGVRVTYVNGQVEEVPVFQELFNGQSTQDIPLRIGKPIQRVDVRYRTKLNFQGEGLVELWGIR